MIKKNIDYMLVLCWAVFNLIAALFIFYYFMPLNLSMMQYVLIGVLGVNFREIFEAGRWLWNKVKK